MTAPVMPSPSARGGAKRGFMQGANANSTDIGEQVNRFQQGMQGAVNAYAEGARESFQQDVGSLLGNMNAIGGLRSGGVQAGTRQLARTFSTNVGREAAQTAGQAAELGLRAAQEGQRRVEYNTDDEFRRNRAAAEDDQFTRRLNFDSEDAIRRDNREAAGQANQLTIAREGFSVDRERIASSDRQAASEMDFRRSRAAAEDSRNASDDEFRRSRASADDSFRDRSLASDENRWKEGYAVDRERIAQSDRQYAGDDAFRRERAGADDAYRTGRATAEDSRFASDDEFRRSRAAVDDTRFASDDEFRRSRASADDTYRNGRAAADDSYRDRSLSENARQYDDTMRYNRAESKSDRKANNLATIGNVAGQILSNGARAGSAVSGAKSGAATGATIGSVIPGVGTVIGGAVGGIVGGIKGWFSKKKK